LRDGAVDAKLGGTKKSSADVRLATVGIAERTAERRARNSPLQPRRVFAVMPIATSGDAERHRCTVIPGSSRCSSNAYNASISMWMVLRIRPSSIGICYPISERAEKASLCRVISLALCELGRAQVNVTKECKLMPKKKTVVRNPWTKEDLRHLKAHSKARTPVVEVAKAMKRTEGAVRQKAKTIGIGLGHRR
jgi:hypothetical protein